MRPVAKGVVLGLALVSVAAIAIVFGFRSVHEGDDSVPSRVVVIMVMRTAEGVTVPRVIADVSETATGGADVRLIDPGLPATVAGTSARTLTDAYSFGGAAAIAQLAVGEDVAWMVLPQEGLERIAEATDGLTVSLSRSIDVFDGQRLHSFAAGEQQVRAQELGALFSGSDYLDLADARKVRGAVGASVLAGFASAPAAVADALGDSSTTSSMDATVRTAWVERFVANLPSVRLGTP